jgi:copper oxidase (laccase) domain-containing protein
VGPHGETDADKKYLDLWLANALWLQGAGLIQDNVETAGLCTACNTDKFYSHRAEKGKTGRFAGLMMIHGRTSRVY